MCSGTCTVRYVSPSGSGFACTVGSPCRSITQANYIASPGDMIVLNAGTYQLGSKWDGTSWTSEQFITKSGIKLYAASGASVIFDGASDITAGPWTTEGSFKYAS